MVACCHCGGPVELVAGRATPCSFCGTSNEPPPQAVVVPVPVQIVHNVVQASDAQAEGARELRCPHCRKRLVTVVTGGVALSGCAGCGGIWVDNASARQVLAAPEAIFGELAQRAGANARDRSLRAAHPTCPACPAVLDRVGAHGLELDVCGDHGTWFDAYELARLVAALRGEAAAPSPSEDRVIRCAGCGQAMKANRAIIGDRGLVCDGCWRERQSELIAAADAQVQQNGALAVGGVLLSVAAVMLGAAASSRD